MSDSEYIPTIGIETHVQLKTKTKLFSSVNNDARQAPPNSLISHIDAGLPGALPVLNKAAIDMCVTAAFALASEPQAFCKFERKHYFYPDLPKGYQITQYENPIISGGRVDILVGGKARSIGIERAHLEEDAGKNIHPAGADYTLVDLNRAGTPMLEIVSRPDIHSPAEAKAYAHELYLLMKYAGVTDGDLYHGHIRFDLNISVSNEPGKLGTRSEVKNLNSFRSVEAASAYEIKRQTDLLTRGQSVSQETRGWDEAKQRTLSQRAKEEAEDYRYMPEPDIPPLELDAGYVKDIKNSMPLLPSAVRQQLSKLDIRPQVIEDILDRPGAIGPILAVLDSAGADDARRAAFWLIQASSPEPEKPDDIEPQIDAERLVSLAQMVTNGEVSSTAAKQIFSQILSSPDNPRSIAQRLNLIQLTDESQVEKLVAEVIAENTTAAEDIKNGNTKAIGFLVGQVMKKSKGQASPGLAQAVIVKQLEL